MENETGSKPPTRQSGALVYDNQVGQHKSQNYGLW